MTGTRRSLISLRDLTAAQLTGLVEAAVRVADDPGAVPPTLTGTVVATLFERTSTRTRTAFGVAALRLGAQVLDYGPASLQTNTGESAEDTARILGLMLDGVVIRSTRTVAELARMRDAGNLPLINAMAREEHPTQAVCDLATLRRHRGTLDGIRVLYVGEGNNTASALAYALARIPGAELTLYTPPGYGLDAASLAAAEKDAVPGARVRQTHERDELPDIADCVYTTRWQTTGTVKEDPLWRQTFRPFHIDEDFLSRWPRAVFLHDLPAHRGEEVSAAVLDSPRSLVWQQARMKLDSATAVLQTFWGTSTT
ncbi:ornithine carbamoyltransferase [Micromonospora sp. WMMD975]|uniref:ornithine carbamoyltransferase n=1 Tax=Micromonospora sp. WMMD975 TaxID=3016087 RepID=UPI002499CB28|nr:ornithine carbamoyltransferase [Micromonospora sp. WMMD975]WFE36547.1 ornithine carbamoyltransferase [Micromonospora sp. WMMD975]